MNVENTWVVNGSSYKTFFEGSTKQDITVLKWTGTSSSNTPWQSEITSASVSSAAPSSTPAKPFRKSLSCAFS
jgi:hypothetical protein